MMSCLKSGYKLINIFLTALTVSTVNNVGQGYLSALAAS